MEEEETSGQDVVDADAGVESEGKDVVGTGQEEVEESPESAMEAEIAKLRKENNTLHGERTQLSEKMNKFEKKMDELVSAQTVVVQTPELEIDDDDDGVTKAQLNEYKKGESQRIADYINGKDKEKEDYNDKYLKTFASQSLEFDDITVKEILKEHDNLERSGKLGVVTEDPEMDARIAFGKAENVYLKKMNAAGKKVPFNEKPSTVTSLGIGGDKVSSPPEKTTKAMPPLPDDAKALMSSLGETAEFASTALGK